ncbi:Gfo/Idh/MocA family oxidoreductase [Streptomyces sp. IBSBF 2953]|nr:Gfo/Idh/MocA family oxidoreductase [Streptomyces hayashii]
MTDRPLRLGVIGCADIAVRRMLPAFAASPEVQLVAVASRDGRRAGPTAERFGCRAVHGYHRLLELDEVEAVYVPLPAALHAHWVEAALRAGRHVLAEKPLTTEAARTRALASLAHERGLVLRENVMFVHHRQHEVVRRLVEDGAIGRLRFFQASFAVPARAEDDIRYDAALGGGALWDVGVYPLRAALHFLGAGLDVVGARLSAGAGRSVDTSGAVLLASAEGVAAQLSFGLEHAYGNAYELWGSRGRITVQRAFTPPGDRPPQVLVDRGSGPEEMLLDPDDQVANTVTAFVHAVRTGAGPDQTCLDQAELLDRVRRAASGAGTDAGIGAGAGRRGS